MKRLILERGKEELISMGGNYLCGHILRDLARKHLSEDFTNVNQYSGDTVFAQSLGIVNSASEPTLRQRLDELPQTRSHLAPTKVANIPATPLPMF